MESSQAGAIATDVVLGDEIRAADTIAKVFQGKPTTPAQWLDAGITLGSDALLFTPAGPAVAAGKWGAKLAAKTVPKAVAKQVASTAEKKAASAAKKSSKIIASAAEMRSIDQHAPKVLRPITFPLRAEGRIYKEINKAQQKVYSGIAKKAKKKSRKNSLDRLQEETYKNTMVQRYRDPAIRRGSKRLGGYGQELQSVGNLLTLPQWNEEE